MTGHIRSPSFCGKPAADTKKGIPVGTTKKVSGTKREIDWTTYAPPEGAEINPVTNVAVADEAAFEQYVANVTNYDLAEVHNEIVNNISNGPAHLAWIDYQNQQEEQLFETMLGSGATMSGNFLGALLGADGEADEGFGLDGPVREGLTEAEENDAQVVAALTGQPISEIEDDMLANKRGPGL